MPTKPTIPPHAATAALAMLLGCTAGPGSTDTDPTTTAATFVTDTTASDSETTNADTTNADTTNADTTNADTTTGPAPDCVPSEPLPEDAVLTTHGPVQGVAADGVTSFRGIPYAAPPTGALRWQPPVAPDCWPEVLLADAPGSVCPQLESETGPVIGDEDCLTLNVFTPQPSPERLRPVMVFLHGGGHTTGSSSDPLYDGARLARERDVVLVTINYRLGALGYLAHEDLDATDPRGVSGNYGLLDQLHALRWVADNASAFGGDPARVTLLGQSAGAVSTCAVVGTPDAEGLVHRAIVQSGTCDQRSSAVYRSAVTTPWIEASACGGDPDVAQCLRALPVDTLLETEPTGFPSVSALGQVWSPYVDGVTLPMSTLARLSTGELDIPLVVGANAEETARDVPPLDDDAYQALLIATFGPLAPLVLAQYPAADYPSPTAAYVALTSDVKFICGARRAARAATEGGAAPVFRYHFTYDGYTVGPMGDPAAFHGLELVYVFGNFDSLLPGPGGYVPNADDQALAELLGDAWTTFARTGDPSTAALAWPSYAISTDPHAGLDAPPFTGQGVRTEQCDFWDGLGAG